MIDLNEIIEEQTGEEISLMNSGHVQGIRACMKKAIREALEFAALEAEVENKIFSGEAYYRVDKDSILQVMGRVK